MHRFIASLLTNSFVYPCYNAIKLPSHCSIFFLKSLNMYEFLQNGRRLGTYLEKMSIKEIIFIDDGYLTFFVQIFYFVGFGLFCLESVLSIWVIQVSFQFHLL